MIHSGKLLKAYKDLKGKSSEELADAAGISLRTYLDIENGVRDMRVQELLAFAEYLEIEPEKLLSTEKVTNSFNKINKSSDSYFCSDNNNNGNGPDKEFSTELLKLLREIASGLQNK